VPVKAVKVKSKLDHSKEAAAARVSSILQRGLDYHQQGDLEQAEKCYRAILEVAPVNAEALHLLGVLSIQKQDSPAAIDLISRAIQIFPDQPIYHNNLGNAYRDSGCCEQAVACYQKALQIRPDLVETYVNMGVAYHRLADLERAVTAFQKAITLKPDCAEAYYNLGNTFKEQRLFDKAISYYEQAASLNPMLVEAFYNQANILEKQARFAEAIACLKQCIQFKPDWAEGHSNLGNLSKQLGFLDDAIAHYQKAIHLKPELDEAHNNLGNAFKDQGSFGKAIDCYWKALQIHPENAEAYLNLGITYAEADHIVEAIGCFQKATELNPQFAEAHNYLGVVLAENGRRDEAIECFQKAIAVNPDYAEAYSYLVHQLQHTCNWHLMSRFSEKLDILIRRARDKGQSIIQPPFICMARNSDPIMNLTVAQTWSRKIKQPLQNVKLPFSFETRRREKPRLTIGYLSGDFHDHATAHLMVRLFGLHDREKFEVHCYSYGPEDNSRYRNQIRKESDQFIDIREHSHIDAARRIYDEGVDILVDLKGHTKGSRPGILACRPAPIQVHYLGYPGSTGADFIDYLITDRIVTPEGHASYYSEKLVFLPHCYQVNDDQQEIASRNWNRETLGLANKGFVFSSFNLPYKIDPVMFNCWMRILQQVPNSALWLFGDNDNAVCNLRREAADRGVGPDRLVFAQKMEKAEHLSRLKWADLALDTRVVNGHTTTSDSLWAGVPVITLQGSHFASRVSSSLLKAVGLSELVTYRLEEYENLALQLASRPSELKAVRRKLNINRLKNPLFDTARFVRNIENAYRKMWRILLEGRAVTQIEVFED
jgi:protein O-GlcNAc transferase